jgi:hypothetical protein
MKLTFLGSESHGGGNPALYATDRGTFVVQGWKITDEGTRAQVRNLPDHEDVVEIPTALLDFVSKGV